MKGNTTDISEALLNWLNNEYMVTKREIQFYTDCYAYDWVLLNNLICPDRDALQLPKGLYYIPVDLSTAMQCMQINPDVTREEFPKQEDVKQIKESEPFKTISENNDMKHNCLWDAFIARECFRHLNNFK
jgi:hypothetical protein